MTSCGGDGGRLRGEFGFKLPEGCVAEVVALTSPQDACRLSLVALTFKSAADSDAVWERFLPPDYEDILALADPFTLPASKKHLYLWLSDHPLLIDRGTKSFSLEKSSGRKCYMLAARGLSIAWGDTPRYWRWTAALPDCRFAEAAELVHVCWLEIRGKISTSMLSPNTTYVAFLVFRLTAGAYGFEPPAEAAIGISGYELETQTVYLDRRRGRRHRCQTVPRPKVRGDGWMEIELGEYLNEEGEERELEMSVKEVKDLYSKTGLIIQGIDIRPKVDK
ncbi:F-box protein PP2-B10-like [Diospyros lotus]|uniref:F-box protein PP2-B10-like n=1 Tax=Diospyros lotus TaxID=55363 RepID=UPI002254785C|nr:F-box protein PP2-B10-like [Diospyros lotus]